MHAGWALWLLGRPAQAVKKSGDGLALARTLAHPATVANVEVFVACLQQWCEELGAVEQLVSSAVSISTAHDFAYPRTMASMLAGWALV
jgi:hypothetical protein